MNDFDLAQSLFKKPAEVVKEAFGGRLPTYTVEAEAMADSEGGFVQVQFMGDTVNLTDGDPDGAGDVTDESAESGEAAQWVEVPCSACIKAGDRVLVTIQDGAPIDCVSIGWGDVVSATASQAEAIATATNQHFWSDTNGIHVSTDDGDAAGTNNILINSLGILLRELTTVLLELSSAGVIVGDQSGTHLKVSSSSVEILSATLQTLLALSKQTRNIDGTDTDLGAITSAMPLLLEHVGAGTSRFYMTDGTNPNKELTRLVEVLGNYTAEIESSANASLGAESKITATSTDGGVHVAQVSTSASSSGSLVNLQGDEILVGFAAPLVYEDKTVTVPSTAAGANYSSSAISVLKTGYSPIGCYQTWWASGTGQNKFNDYGTHVEAGNLYVRLHNYGTAAASDSLKCRILYVKLELL